jgi:hypothetical protein
MSVFLSCKNFNNIKATLFLEQQDFGKLSRAAAAFQSVRLITKNIYQIQEIRLFSYNIFIRSI